MKQIVVVACAIHGFVGHFVQGGLLRFTFLPRAVVIHDRASKGPGFPRDSPGALVWWLVCSCRSAVFVVLPVLSRVARTFWEVEFSGVLPPPLSWRLSFQFFSNFLVVSVWFVSVFLVYGVWFMSCFSF